MTMTWHRTDLAADAMHERAWNTAVVDGQPIAFIAWDGRWYALEDRCSHAGCAFSEDGEIDGFRVICDCHGSEFDIRTGEVLQGPAQDPVTTFPVRIEAGTIEVAL